MERRILKAAVYVALLLAVIWVVKAAMSKPTAKTQAAAKLPWSTGSVWARKGVAYGTDSAARIQR